MTSTTVIGRTARDDHECGTCHGPIKGGHRYLRHTLFPGSEDGHPMVTLECVRCAVTNEHGLDTGACEQYCCGIEPCALPAGHWRSDADHSCHRCQKVAQRWPSRREDVKPIVIIPSGDEESVEIRVGDRTIIHVDHDIHGWAGIGAVVSTARGIAEALGVPVRNGE